MFLYYLRLIHCNTYIKTRLAMAETAVPFAVGIILELWLLIYVIVYMPHPGAVTCSISVWLVLMMIVQLLCACLSWRRPHRRLLELADE